MLTLSSVMQVILLEDVHKLGNAGELVKVKPGYARNFLLAKGAAVFADDSAIVTFERKREKLRAEAEGRRVAAEEYKKSLESAERIVVTAKAGETGKLFGSITKEAIAHAILDQLKIEVDRHKITVSKPITELGDHPIKVGLGAGVESDFVVQVDAVVAE